jgi:hypothetical protein
MRLEPLDHVVLARVEVAPTRVPASAFAEGPQGAVFDDRVVPLAERHVRAVAQALGPKSPAHLGSDVAVDTPLDRIPVRKRRVPQTVAAVMFQERDDVPHAGGLGEAGQTGGVELARLKQLDEIVRLDVVAPDLRVVIAELLEEPLLVPIGISRLLSLRRPACH